MFIKTALNYDNLCLYSQIAAIDPKGPEKMDEYIESAVKSGENINRVVDGINGDTFLHLAIRDEKIKLISALIRNGANPNIQNGAGLTAKQLADKHPKLHGQIIWSLGRPPESKDSDQAKEDHFLLPFLQAMFPAKPMTKPQESCQQGITEELFELIKKGNLEEIKRKGREKSWSAAFMKGKDSQARNCAHIAALSNHPRILAYILAKGYVSTCAIDNEGRTPLHLAALQGNKAVINYLINNTGAKNDVKDNKGQTPYHLAAVNGDIETFIALKRPFEISSNVESIDHEGANVLHLAARNGNLSLIEYLINQESKSCQFWIKEKTEEGLTPLEEAFKFGHLDIINLLTILMD